MKHLGNFLFFLIVNTVILAPGFILASNWLNQDLCIMAASCTIMSFTYTDITIWKQDEKYLKLLKN